MNRFDQPPEVNDGGVAARMVNDQRYGALVEPRPQPFARWLQQVAWPHRPDGVGPFQARGGLELPRHRQPERDHELASPLAQFLREDSLWLHGVRALERLGLDDPALLRPGQVDSHAVPVRLWD